jgi:hypothetical protein
MTSHDEQTHSGLGIDTNSSTYSFLAFCPILWLMQNEINGCEETKNESVEYRKGCPVCEHSDPELERELQAFAQLLFDIYLDQRTKEQESGSGAEIDNTP